MTRRILVWTALCLAGCAYYNALYNANRAYDDAEAARREGRESSARARYAEAIEKAAKSYRSDEDGRWADDALYLIGRSHARRGDWPEARAALEAAIDLTEDSSLASGARVFLGAAEVSLGDEIEGMALLDDALDGLDDDRTRAEAFLWRARAHAALGSLEAAWRDLDSAAVGGDRYRDEAALDRLTWGTLEGEHDQAERGVQTLLASNRAAAAVDTIEALVRLHRRQWGPDQTLPLLVGVESAPWQPGERETLLLLRARIAADASDTARAVEDARRVSSGVGAAADEARVLLAEWRLSGVSQPSELDEVRGLLLPAVGAARAIVLLDAIKTVGLLVERSSRRGQALALFAAAEVARDDLDAPRLARTLFMAYADLERGAAWEGKALLAALALSRTEEERKPLMERLSEIPDNAYVAAAAWRLGDRHPEFQLFERRLEGTLATIRAQVASEAQSRDVLVAEAVRVLDSVRTSEAIARRLEQGDSTVLDSLRLDSLRADSIRRDSIRRDSMGLDSLFADTLFVDTLGAVSRRRPGHGPLRPTITWLREGERPAFRRPGPGLPRQ